MPARDASRAPAIRLSTRCSTAAENLCRLEKNNFVPRLGIAYQVNAKTVVRTGFGGFKNRPAVSDSTFLGGQFPVPKAMPPSPMALWIPGLSFPVEFRRNSFRPGSGLEDSDFLSVERYGPAGACLGRRTSKSSTVGRVGLLVGAHAQPQPASRRHLPAGRLPGRSERELSGSL